MVHLKKFKTGCYGYTDIMGPLTKLWVMIENANSENDGNNAPVVFPS